MGKHRALSTKSVTHPLLRRLTAAFSILILIATSLGGGAVYAINSLGKNIVALDTSDLNNQKRPETVVQTDTSATNILIMGSDSRAGSNGSYGNVDGARSDTTLLVHIYKGRKAATVVSIPRDSFVEIAGCKMLNGETSFPYETKFNAAFAIGGPICTVKTVEKLTNIRINNFVVVDFEAFKKVVDALGGVEVCLTSPAYDPIVPGRGGSGLNLPAGYSNITGEQALAFVRARESLGDGSDLSRITRQQEFIGSMIRGMTDKGLLTNPGMIYRVLSAVTSSITTNTEFASISALQNFALSLGSLKPSKINFVTTPYEMVGKGNVGWTSEADELWTALRMDQPWPPVAPSPSATPTNQSTTTPGATSIAPKDISFSVLNATSTVGLASTAGTELKAMGYDVVKVGNSTQRITASEILYKSKNLAAAQALAQEIGVTKLTLDETLVSPIVLLVAPDWKNGSANQKPASPSTSASPQPSSTPTDRTAAAATCTKGNNRKKN
ncbi:MAG: LytR family transcriptional regulator [Actinobacteria bacterium]|nr:LytR family transcriptional regulator [Actinomycetota bacterium]